MLGPGEVRSDRAFEVRDWGTRRGPPLSRPRLRLRLRRRGHDCYTGNAMRTTSGFKQVKLGFEGRYL